MPPKSKSKSKSKPKPKSSAQSQPPPRPTTPKAPTAAAIPPQIPPQDPAHGQEATPRIQRTLPCATFIKDECANFYYPYGNSIPEDLFLHLNVFASPGWLTSIDALLAGSGAAAGDLRHVLYTLSELRRKLAPSEAVTPTAIAREHYQSIVAGSSQPLPLTVRFHVNDHQPEVIARNILILHAISNWSGPVTPTLVQSIAQFWYSIALDPTVSQFWREQMQACLDRPDADWLLSTAPTADRTLIRISDPATLKQLKHVWRTWLKCTWTLSQLSSAREQRLMSSPVRPSSMRDFAKSICEHFTATLVTFGQSNNAQVRQITAEAEQFVQHGRWFNSGSGARLQSNPSMLLTRADGSCYFVGHYGTLPMEGHVFDLKREGGVKVERDMMENVAGWVASLHALIMGDGPAEPAVPSSAELLAVSKSASMGKGKGQAQSSPRSPTESTATTLATTRPIHIHFTFNIDHLLSYMESLTLTPTRFDVISTANSADHCGLLNLLLHSSPLLKPASPLLPHTPHVLTTSILLGNSADNRQDYVRQMLGMDMQHVPVLLGLQLLELTDGSAAGWASVVEPFGWSRAYVDDLGSRSLYRFTWLGCPVPSAPVSMADSKGVVEALVKVASENCGSHMHKMIRPGGPLTSGALIGTLIAHAISSNRISWTDPSPSRSTSTVASNDRTPVPIHHVPASFWNCLTASPTLADTITDVLMHAQMRGLSVSTRYEYALHVQATFPLVFDSFSTPNLVVCFEYGGRQYFTEAMRIVEMYQVRRTITVAVYLPGLVSSWDSKAVRMSLHRPHVIGPGQGYYAPMGGKVWTLDQLVVEKVLVEESPWLPVRRAIADRTKAVIEARRAREEEGEAKVVKVIDSGAMLAVAVDVSAYGDDVKIALPTPKQVESGHGGALIRIDGQLHRFWMPSRVLLKKAQHSRKSRTVDLVFTKLLHAHVPSVGLLGLPFHQRLHGLPALTPSSVSPGDLANRLGFVFSQAEEQYRKSGHISPALMTSNCITAYHIKGLAQQIATFAIKGHKSFMFSRADGVGSESQISGHLGILLINGLHLHPPTYSGRVWTLALDVTVSVLPPPASAADPQHGQEYMEAMRQVLDAVVAQRGHVLKATRSALSAAVAEWLELATAQCGNRDELPYPLIAGKIKGVPVAARRYLKRGIVTVLGPAEDLVKEVWEERGPAAGLAAQGGSMLHSVPVLPRGQSAQANAPREKVGSGLSEMLRGLAQATGQDPREIMQQMGLGAFDL